MWRDTGCLRLLMCLDSSRTGYQAQSLCKLCVARGRQGYTSEITWSSRPDGPRSNGVHRTRFSACLNQPAPFIDQRAQDDWWCCYWMVEMKGPFFQMLIQLGTSRIMSSLWCGFDTPMGERTMERLSLDLLVVTTTGSFHGSNEENPTST
ncbi:hypothetical protein BJX63DRAFT_28781 [Aspergillus granulosus]|uniref:Uncharacterized protein n=1 Tax=Aspergillus granulosus TaxID=176169 RepID=A0ABR4HUH4_9EURO